MDGESGLKSLAQKLIMVVISSRAGLDSKPGRRVVWNQGG